MKLHALHLDIISDEFWQGKYSDSLKELTKHR